MRIEGKGIGKRFGPIEALKGIDFVVPTGNRIGLIGPNASGKSTLIRIVLGLLEYDGELRLDGSLGRGPGIARRIAYVPQIAPTFGASVRDVVRTITRVRGISPDEVTRRAADLGMDLPGVERQAFRNLSGGAKQKVLLALALSSEASLLVLDEPTASLDTASRMDFFAQLSEQERSPTVILCSHRLEEIRSLVDRVMVLDEGSLTYFGPTERYLDRVTLSTIEVRTLNGTGSEVLERMGFRPGVAGWWRRTATRTEKVSLIEELSKTMAGQLGNLSVRDAEAVQPKGEEDQS